MKTKVQCFFKRAEAFMVLLILGIAQTMAQSAAGIDQATAEVSSYVDPYFGQPFLTWYCE
jgi:hypothetical protein